MGHSGFLEGAEAPAWQLTLMCPPLSPAVAVNIGRSLLFLVLLLGVIGGCHWWHHLGG